MNTTFIEILKKLINEQGKEALFNPAKCKAFLADYTKGEFKKESRLLLQALEAGVQKEIDATVELEICKKQQVRVLQEEYFLTAEIAADVVDTLALVLRGEQKNETSQGTLCADCGKTLQKEWKACPYCGTSTIKIQQKPPVAKTSSKTKPEPPQKKSQPIPSPESDFKVNIEGRRVVITEYLGSKHEIRIPPLIQNLPVTNIGGGAFDRCTSLTSVTIPNSVTSIGEWAFGGCSSLTCVTFQGSVSLSFWYYSFPGDLDYKYEVGGVGTYTRQNGTKVWKKQ
jgi:predicted Zn-ribbon and HTH transcriptional regulator